MILDPNSQLYDQLYVTMLVTIQED